MENRRPKQFIKTGREWSCKDNEHCGFLATVCWESGQGIVCLVTQLHLHVLGSYDVHYNKTCYQHIHGLLSSLKQILTTRMPLPTTIGLGFIRNYCSVCNSKADPVEKHCCWRIIEVMFTRDHCGIFLVTISELGDDSGEAASHIMITVLIVGRVFVGNCSISFLEVQHTMGVRRVVDSLYVAFYIIGGLVPIWMPLTWGDKISRIRSALEPGKAKTLLWKWGRRMHESTLKSWSHRSSWRRQLITWTQNDAKQWTSQAQFLDLSAFNSLRTRLRVSAIRGSCENSPTPPTTTASL